MLFFGKAKCATCHPGPVLHRQPDARPEGRAVLQDADASTVWSPPPRGRSRRSRCAASRRARRTCTTAGLLTLEDTVEFFNLILETQLTEEEKKDLVAFLKCL